MRRANTKSRMHWRRAAALGALAFLVAVLLAVPARSAMSDLEFPLAVFSLLLIVLVGVVFDLIGVAAVAAEEAPFHAMSASDRPGAREALWLVRRAETVNSFSLDVIGDVVGTLSGAAGAVIVLRLTVRFAWEEALLSVLVVATIAALTVGTKAAGKGLAMSRATSIVYAVGRLLYLLRRAGIVRLDPRRSDRPERPRRTRRSEGNHDSS